MQQGERRALAVAVGLAALLLLPGIGRLDLWAPDEPRIAQISEELRRLDHGPESLVLLRLDAEPYTQKPPLYYWLAALAGAPSQRVSEAAARLPSALSGIALVGLTAALSLRLFPGSQRVALWAALVLLTSLRFTITARRAQLDTLLALCEAAAIYAFACRPQRRGAHSTGERRGDTLRLKQSWSAVLCTSLALGLLTKGPVALLVLASMALLLWWEGEPLRVRDVFAPRWVAWCLGPVLAWLFVAIALAPPGFAEAAVVENLFGRFFSGTSHARPFWYYARQWPADFLPWTPVALAAAVFAWRRARAATDRERAAWRLLVAWVAVPLVFFSLSGGKRGLYLLPIYPALAIASAVWLDRFVFTRSQLPGPALAALALLAGATALAGGAAATGFGEQILDDAGLDAGALRWAGAWAAFATAAGALAFRSAGLRRSAHGQAIAVAATWISLLLIAVHIALPAADRQKSPRLIAEAAASVAGARPIGLYQQRATLPGVVYYAGRSIESLHDSGSVRDFWARGGGALILRSRQLSEVDPLARHAVRARVRGGRRELLVLGSGGTSTSASIGTRSP